jgi:uncharacterized membrane-anchored protein
MHARPADQLVPPVRVSYLALFSDPDSRDLEWAQLVALLNRCGVPAPVDATNHHNVDLGAFRVRWERHTEFVRYTFIVGGVAPPGQGEDIPALASVPADWLASLSGRTLVALHVSLLSVDEDQLNIETLGNQHYPGSPLIGSGIADGAAITLTDMRLWADGFGRWLLIDQGLAPRQAGRILQSLLEVDTYRSLALLALPVARALSPALGRFELELSAVTSALAQATAEDEPALLERLMRLEAHIESLESQHLFRFEAANAYYELVQRRLRELRETRLRGGLPTLQEFIDRRLAPAMTTCRSVAARLESLSQRVARANQLLSTRIGITHERQNQELLASMNRRAHAQLRLQQTVEGLSVAAVTYYVVGLIGYAAKGVSAAGLHVSSEIAMAIGIPVVALVVASGVRHTRRMVKRVDA